MFWDIFESLIVRDDNHQNQENLVSNEKERLCWIGSKGKIAHELVIKPVNLVSDGDNQTLGKIFP